MKIKVIANTSDEVKRAVFTPYDFGYTEESWDKLSDENKNRIVQDALDGLEQPYWVLDTFTEIKK